KRAREAILFAWFAAAVGAPIHRASDPPTASGSRPSTGSTITASELPELPKRFVAGAWSQRACTRAMSVIGLISPDQAFRAIHDDRARVATQPHSGACPGRRMGSDMRRWLHFCNCRGGWVLGLLPQLARG